jgi:hypothetical protein
MGSSVPDFAKLHALRHLVPKVVANKLLKATGLDTSDVCVALAASLSTSTLIGFLDGTRLNASSLLACHNMYVKARAPGSREITLDSIWDNLGLFCFFIATTIKILASLGIHAENLTSLVDSAFEILEAVPTLHASLVLKRVILPSLQEALEQCGSFVKAWVETLSLSPLGELTLEDTRIVLEILAIQDDWKRNLSQFGLHSASVFSSFYPIFSLETSLQESSSSHSKRKLPARGSREAWPSKVPSHRQDTSSSPATRTRTRTHTNPYGTKANAAG